jgi:hypothetical protein
MVINKLIVSLKLYFPPIGLTLVLVVFIKRGYELIEGLI